MRLGEIQTGISLKRSGPSKLLYIQVAEQIQHLIKGGDLVPDDQLLPERELAEKFGVSRTSVRNALAYLHGQGAIAVNPRDGAYVRERTLEDALVSLVDVLFQEREQVAHLFEVRRIIETQAAYLAAKRRTEADVQYLRVLNRQFEANLTRGDLAFEANTRFHIGIVETAKNPLLNAIMCTLLTATIAVYAKAREQSLSSAGNLSRFVDQHEVIIKAIQQQDPKLAANLIAEHIDDARKRVEEIVESELKKGA
jgi:GntR family transcriptional repressor for pyruvate dehydrogenase complex